MNHQNEKWDISYSAHVSIFSSKEKINDLLITIGDKNKNISRNGKYVDKKKKYNK